MSFAALPNELHEKIVSYIPKNVLDKLLEMPYIGDVCFCQLYAEVYIGKIGLLREMDLTEEPYFLPLSSGGIASMEQEQIATIRFLSAREFVDFTTANSHRLNYKLVTFTTFEHYTDLNAIAPEILQALACVGFAVMFDRRRITLEIYDELEEFETMLVTPVDQVSIIAGNDGSSHPTLYGLDLMGQEDMTSLTLSFYALASSKMLFDPFINLKSLSLRDTKISDLELQFLPPYLESLSMTLSLKITSFEGVLEFPDSLKELNLHYIEMPVDQPEQICIDLRHLDSLRSLEVAGFERSFEIQAPPSLKSLQSKDCLKFENVTDLTNMNGLRSLSISYRESRSIMGFLISNTFPDSIKKLVFREQPESESTQVVDMYKYLPSVASQERPFIYRRSTYSSEGFTCDNITHTDHIMISQRFHFPLECQLLDISSPLLMFSKPMLPPCLNILKLCQIHKITKFNQIAFPQALESIEIYHSKVEDFHGVQFPTNLTKLILFDCSLESFSQTNISELKKLESLDLDGNSIKDGSFISELPPSIQSLSLECNHLQVVNLENCPKLKMVDLAGCKLQKLSYTQLNLPDSVEELYCHENPITDVDADFKFPANLKILRFDAEFGLTQETFCSKLPPSLTSLDIKWGYQERDATAGCKLPEALEKLEVDDGPFPLDNFFFGIYECHNLKSIELTRIHLSTIRGDALPISLESFVVDRSKFSWFKGNINHLHHLTQLKISSTELQHTKLILPKNLKYLELHDCNITRPELVVDLSECSSLVEVSLLDNEELNRECFKKFASDARRHNPKLEEIYPEVR